MIPRRLTTYRKVSAGWYGEYNVNCRGRTVMRENVKVVDTHWPKWQEDKMQVRQL